MNILEKLEFNKIQNILQSFCITNIGKSLALELSPSYNTEKVKYLLLETKEACDISNILSTPRFNNITTIDIEVKIIKSNGFLNMKQLLTLANILKQSQILKTYFSSDEIDLNAYPILSDIFSCLYSNKSISDKIFSCVIDENTIDDNSSSNLKNIRKNIKNLEQNIRNKLNTIIHSSTTSKYLQDNIITIRNNRFVVPVKEECRSEIKGFIHDISNAGSTIFIEPLAIFDLNNKLNQLILEEELEIEKILYELTNLFSPYIYELLKNTELIGKLDFIFAKAKYSKKILGITPVINSKKYINLISSRHPLIDENTVVPININLGVNYSTLLITGPNTGGKTVCLKTTGLLLLMAYSGLNIPTAKNSSIYVFDNIFVDIGDDQSITNSLSTFSSHMLNIISILKNITHNSLVLIDELGSGTDPLEGANLAISILEHIKTIGSLTIITSHYQELKNYALITKEFQNASVEFNLETLSPTYKLLTGIPGKSNAFEISKKLGLDINIISRAKSLLTSNEITIEELLKNIYDDKIAIEKNKINLEKELKQATSIRKSLTYDLHTLNDKKIELINTAKIEARDILLNAKNEANLIIKDLKNRSEDNNFESSRNKLNNMLKNIKIEQSNIDTNTSENISPNDLQLNTEVFITTLNQTGTIVSTVTKNNTVQVQIGSMKLNINIKNLKVIGSKKTHSISSTYTTNKKNKIIKTELNVIGENVEQAIFDIDKYLDDCYMSSLKNVCVIHGKGSGILSKHIHIFLKTHPHVKSFRFGNFGEGETGVTIVELK